MKILEIANAIYPGGKVGLCGDVPARFRDVKVDAAASVKTETLKKIASRDARLRKLRSDNPQPRLWKKFPWKGLARPVM